LHFFSAEDPVAFLEFPCILFLVTALTLDHDTMRFRDSERRTSRPHYNEWR
jgi:hypothetical protein